MLHERSTGLAYVCFGSLNNECSKLHLISVWCVGGGGGLDSLVQGLAQGLGRPGGVLVLGALATGVDKFLINLWG